MGSYAESLLTPDEKILTRERQHWLALILDSWLAIILWGVAIILIVVNIFLPDEIFGWNLFGAGTWFSTAGTSVMIMAILLGMLVVLIRWWWWRTQEFLVTNRRLVLAWGILNKSASDSSLEKINDAQLEISVLGRILDYGQLKVLTAAPLQGADYLDRLNHAKAFKKVMMTAKHDLQTGVRGEIGDDGSPAPATTAVAPPPVEEKGSAPKIDVSGGKDPLKADTPDEVTALLERLAKLRDEGHISSGEYKMKKQELLDRL